MKRVINKVRSWSDVPIILILLTGIILRLLFIKTRGIWYDDAFSILLSQRSIPEIISGTAADTMPPLYYFLLHYWGIISQQIWFLRLLNVFLSTITIYIIFRFVKMVGGNNAGLLAAFFTTLSPFQIYHAQEIRMYMVLELALVIHIYFFLRLFIDSGQTPWKNFWIIGLIISGVVALYSHNLAIFTLIALDIFLLIQKEWKKLGKYILIQGIMGILFLPWLLFLPGQIEKIQTAFWTPRPGLVQIVQAYLSLFGTLPLDTMGIYITTISISLVVVILVLLSPKSLIKRAEIRLITCLVFAPPIILFMASWLMRPIYVPRAFIVSGLMAYALAGIILTGGIRQTNDMDLAGKSATRTTGLRIFGIGLMVLISAVSLPYQYTYHSFPRSDYRKLMEIAGEGCNSGCIIVHDNKLSYFPAIIYDNQQNQVFIADEAGSHNDTLAIASQKAMNIFAQKDIQEAVGDNQKVRFVVYTRAIEEYKQAGIEIHPKIKWLNDNYHFVDHEVIGDIEIYDYLRP